MKVTPDALARLEMAKEKARIRRKRPTAPSELEQAAQRWKEGKELREVGLTYREPDDSPIAIASVPLHKVMDKVRQEEEVIWRQHRLHPEERSRQIKMNAAMICTIAMHLRAREWARAMGKTRRQPNDGYDLEKAAEKWWRRKELEKRGILKMNQRSASR